MPDTLPRPARNAELGRDPTQTITLRREFAAAASKRWRTLKGIIRDGVEEADLFGLGERRTAQQTEAARQALNDLRRLARGATEAGDLDQLRDVARNFVLTPGRFDFPAADAVETFDEWLRVAQESHVLEVARSASGEVVTQDRWEQVFVRRGYVKGLFDADAKMNRAGIDVPDADPAAVVNLPVHSDALRLLHQRAFGDLAGITEASAQTIRRELAQGFAEGVGPRTMASRINDRVDAVGIHRSRVLARTEVIRAHAEATLNRFEQFGVEEVAGRAEFSTSSDDRVCPVCEGLEGQIFTLEEARGVVPVHPSCRL